MAGVVWAAAWCAHPDEGFVFCPLRRFTGIPCAGCGMTRAMCALARGDFGRAWAFHPASIPLAAGLAGVLGLVVTEAITGVERVRPVWDRACRWGVWVVLVLVTAGWIRNLVVHFG